MKESLKGQVFNDLTIIDFSHNNKYDFKIYKCLCICGNIHYTRLSDLKSNKTKSCGCLKRRKPYNSSILGQKFGNFTVISFIKKSTRGNVYDCQCDCGTHMQKTFSTINNKNSGGNACIKCGRKYLKEGTSGLNRLIRQYKHDAKKRNYIFDLTKDEVYAITTLNCSYCGNPPSSISKSGSNSTHGDYVYNGMDRVDNNVGYIISNVVPCCNICNWMKSNLLISDFESHIIKIYNNFKK